jgi:protein-tyrosine phosphatase
MAWSDQKCKVFDKDFKLEFFFESVPSENQAFQEDIPEEAFSPASSTEVGTDFTFLPENNVSVLKEPFPCANLGAWRPMRRASFYTRTRVEKEKCCNYATVVQPQSFTIYSEEAQEFCSLVPIPDNLCVDTGPPVEHQNVQLHSLDVNHMVQNSGNESNMNLKRIRNLRESRSILQRSGSSFSNRVRAIVSLNKKRFQNDGFDLDLTYITPRVIAMGYPAATGIEGTYRNSREEVYRFFQERHSGHFRIINLVLERGYDLTLYHNSVARYGFRDHNAPALELLLPCCAHMHRYLQAQKDNIVAVHCKAGKGRTGLVIVCYLLYSGLQKKASLARNFYDKRRCHDGKGLTILSQIRYAHYFEKCLARIKSGVECPVSETQSPAIVILAVAMHGMPSFSSNEPEVLLQIVVRSEDDHEEYVIYKSQPCSLNSKGRVWYLEPNKNVFTRLHPDQNAYNNMSKFQNMKNDANIANERTTGNSPELVSQAPDNEGRVGGVRVAGDIKFEFCRQMSGSKQKYLCHTWTHSQFMDDPPNIMEDQQWREPDWDVSQWSTKYPPAKSHHLSDEETRVLNQGAGLDLPNGSSSLSISKHEIEGAAQDKKNIHFPGNFKIQVFWKYLPNQKGTGDTLAAAVKAAKTATSSGIDDCIPPLEKEKAEYSEYLRTCRKNLTKPLSFTQHILSHSINQKKEELLALHTKSFRSLRKLSNPENM